MKYGVKNNEKYFSDRVKSRIGLFLLVAACISYYFVILRWDQVKDFGSTLMSILQPIIIGLVLAYLLRSPVNFFEQKIFDHRKSATLRLLNSVLIVYCAVGCALYMVLSVIWPELKNNMTNMITGLPGQIESIIGYMELMLADESQVAGILRIVLEELYSKVNHWMEYEMWDYANVVFSKVTIGVIDLIGLVFNIIIGILVSIYVLMERKHFGLQGKKLAYAFLKEKDAAILLETVAETDRIFSGFINGKIVDSAIIGLLCFISLTFLDMPYTVLVSIIVGVTNVIPFFGPYLGAIPSAVLIFLADWRQGFVFVIFIIILQQVDGNLIGPKILGDSTGVASFWIVFAILLAGGLFGIPGMIMGVPTFATVYYIVKTYVDYRLKKNGTLSQVTDTADVSSDKERNE